MKYLLSLLSLGLFWSACDGNQGQSGTESQQRPQVDLQSPAPMVVDQGGTAGGMGGAPAGGAEGEVEPQRPNYAALIQEVTRDIVGETGSVGAVVVVVSAAQREVVGLGSREIGGPPVDRQTVFQIGSVSKPITGLMLAGLIESSPPSLRADDPVNAHLSDITAPSGTAGPITLEQLATHYSALPNFPDNLIGPRTSPGRGYTRALLNDFLSTHRLSGEPGEGYTYSNLGYGLLGLSLSDAEGVSGYEQLLADRFSRPLGLSRTGLNRPGFLARVDDNLSQGYGGPDGRVEVGLAEMGALAGSGEILSTGEDMALFLSVMCGLSAYPVEGAIERALAPRAPGEGAGQIAYGWDVADAEPRLWTKTGLTAGFTAYVALRRDPQVGVAILSNRGRHRAVQAAVRTLITQVALDADP